MSTTDRKALLETVTAQVIAGMSVDDAARTRPLLKKLVDDWYREAGTDDDAQAVLELLRGELEAEVRALAPAARVEAVRAAVLDREVRQLGVKTFQLGKQVIDRAVPPETASVQGQALMRLLDQAAGEVKKLADAAVRARLVRDLQEASMEALYAIHHKGMSLRLSHYASDAAGQVPDHAGPPHVL